MTVRPEGPGATGVSDTDTDTGTDRARALRSALAGQLADAGHLRDGAWRAAVEEVPRHLFVPRYFRQDMSGAWRAVANTHPGHLEDVYSDRALTTQITDNAPTSSSSEPGLMLTMLEALDVRDGHTVLEVGTGTGYNAALLSHRLGGGRVTTVDVDPELTGPAADRLVRAGYRPAVRTGDGALGVPGRAPFDRIIATCGMRAVPWPWIEQAAEGAVIVVPVGWGLARLTVRDGSAEGRFLATGAYFMPRRTDTPPPRFADLEGVEPRPAAVPVPEAVDRLRFSLSLVLPGHGSCTWQGERTGAVRAVGLWTPDGSVAKADAGGTVRQTGPRRLWDVVEELNQLFPGTAPAREDFGITVTPERQWVWLAEPDGLGWDLPE